MKFPTLPKLPPIPTKPSEIPAFGLYVAVAAGTSIFLLIVCVYFGYMAVLNIRYPMVTIVQVTAKPADYKDASVRLSGAFLNFRDIQTPLCVPQGGKQFPDLQTKYKYYPSSWGLIAENEAVAVHVIDPLTNQKIETLPNYTSGESLTLTGTLRLITTLDDCNKDLAYPSLILEVSPDQVGLEQ